MATVHVEIVSPEQVLYSGEAEIVVCRTSGGEIAFLPGHVPFLGMLGIAQVWIREPDGTDRYAAVHRGFVEVSNDRVSILSDVAELPDQIDLVRAETARDAAGTPCATPRRPGAQGGPSPCRAANPGRPRPARTCSRLRTADTGASVRWTGRRRARRSESAAAPAVLTRRSADKPRSGSRGRTSPRRHGPRPTSPTRTVALPTGHALEARGRILARAATAPRPGLRFDGHHRQELRIGVRSVRTHMSVLAIVGMVSDMRLSRAVLATVIEAGDEAETTVGSYIGSNLIGAVSLVVSWR